jgi:hypothetical protein
MHNDNNIHMLRKIHMCPDLIVGYRQPCDFQRLTLSHELLALSLNGLCLLLALSQSFTQACSVPPRCHSPSPTYPHALLQHIQTSSDTTSSTTTSTSPTMAEKAGAKGWTDAEKVREINSIANT